MQALRRPAFQQRTEAANRQCPAHQTIFATTVIAVPVPSIWCQPFPPATDLTDKQHRMRLARRPHLEGANSDQTVVRQLLSSNDDEARTGHDPYGWSLALRATGAPMIALTVFVVTVQHVAVRAGLFREADFSITH